MVDCEDLYRTLCVSVMWLCDPLAWFVTYYLTTMFITAVWYLMNYFCIAMGHERELITSLTIHNDFPATISKIINCSPSPRTHSPIIWVINQIFQFQVSRARILNNRFDLVSDNGTTGVGISMFPHHHRMDGSATSLCDVIYSLVIIKYHRLYY